jgi:hypothetical protein
MDFLGHRGMSHGPEMIEWPFSQRKRHTLACYIPRAIGFEKTQRAPLGDPRTEFGKHWPEDQIPIGSNYDVLTR